MLQGCLEHESLPMRRTMPSDRLKRKDLYGF